MELMDYIASRIRELRTGYASGEGLSQEALAKSLGIAPNTISRWETGTYHPSIEDLEKLARFFGMPILTFFPNAEQMKEDKVTPLLRTARELEDTDLEELQRYAEFRRARSFYKGKARPSPGRKRKESK